MTRQLTRNRGEIVWDFFFLAFFGILWVVSQGDGGSTGSGDEGGVCTDQSGGDRRC